MVILGHYSCRHQRRPRRCRLPLRGGGGKIWTQSPTAGKALVYRAWCRTGAGVVCAQLFSAVRTVVAGVGGGENRETPKFGNHVMRDLDARVVMDPTKPTHNELVTTNFFSIIWRMILEPCRVHLSFRLLEFFVRQTHLVLRPVFLVLKACPVFFRNLTEPPLLTKQSIFNRVATTVRTHQPQLSLFLRGSRINIALKMLVRLLMFRWGKITTIVAHFPGYSVTSVLSRAQASGQVFISFEACRRPHLV